jgi:hypothetical protein
MTFHEILENFEAVQTGLLRSRSVLTRSIDNQLIAMNALRELMNRLRKQQERRERPRAAKK